MKFNTIKMEDALESLIDYRGKTPKKSETGIATLSAKSVKNGYIDYSQCYYISAEEYKRFMVRGFPKIGDILLTTEAPMGMVARLDRDDVAVAQRLLTLRGKKGVMDNDYLMYLLQSPKGQALLSARETGTTVTGIKQSEFRKIELDLPPIAEQKKIAAILRRIDDKIALNQRINDNLQQQVQALFNNYYGRSDEKVSFTSIIQIWGGGTPKTKEAKFWNGNIPFFTPKDVNNPYTLTTEKSITEIGLEHCNSRLFPINTVFVTARGTVGKVGLAGVPMAMNQSCYALVGKTVNQLLTYFYTLATIDKLKHKASGAVFDAITVKDFEGEQVMLLKDTDSRSFLSIAEPIYNKILNNSIENQNLIRLRDVLLPELMSGRIDLSDIEF